MRLRLYAFLLVPLLWVSALRAQTAAPAGQTAASLASTGLAITGDIPAPLTLSLEQLAKLPHTSITVREHDGSEAAYEGVALIDLLRQAGAPTGKDLKGPALASYLLATAHDGYQVTFALAELDPAIGPGSAMVADKRNGAAMTAPLGPLRIIVPSDKKPARSIRMLEKLQIVLLRRDPAAAH